MGRITPEQNNSFKEEAQALTTAYIESIKNASNAEDRKSAFIAYRNAIKTLTQSYYDTPFVRNREDF